jgi:hypothetical protein
MKKSTVALISSVLTLLLVGGAASAFYFFGLRAEEKEDLKVEVNERNFPDIHFRQWIQEHVSGAADGILTGEEIDSVERIDISSHDISDLTGIGFFRSLRELYCQGNNLTRLDLSADSLLTYLDCSNNELVELDLNHNAQLVRLNCANNHLQYLDVNRNPMLTHINCAYNSIKYLDLSHNYELSILMCNNNYLDSINVTQAKGLTGLNCANNQMRELDLFQNTRLEKLFCQNNQLEWLNLSKNYALCLLDCSENCINRLDLRHNYALTRLHCHNNQLSWLDLSRNKKLRDKANVSIAQKEQSAKVASIFDRELGIAVEEAFDGARVGNLKVERESDDFWDIFASYFGRSRIRLTEINASVTRKTGDPFLLIDSTTGDANVYKGRKMEYDYDTGNLAAGKLHVRMRLI